MIKCRDVMEIMECIAPKQLAEDWDNPGLLVGSPDDEIRRILVCLDVREETVARAKAEDFQMIVAHHPVIFKGLKKLRTDLPDGRLLGALIRFGIAVFAAHTNLDCAEGGVNDVLAKSLGISGLKVLENLETGFQSRIGTLMEEITADELAQRCKEVLGGNIRYVKGDRPIKTVAVCGGSGTDMVYPAILCGADALVTADIKHSMFITAAEKGFTLIDAGHYFTENIIVEPLALYLEKHTGLDVSVSNYTPVNVL